MIGTDLVAALVLAIIAAILGYAGLGLLAFIAGAIAVVFAVVGLIRLLNARGGV